MGFFAVVLALLIERLRPLRPDNRLRATIGQLARTVRFRLDSGRRRDGALGWVLVMALGLLAVLVAEWLAGSLHPIFVFALHVFVLYCTIGFRQLGEAFTEIRVAFAADDAVGASRILAGWVRDSDTGEASVSLDPVRGPAETCRKTVAHALLFAHRQVLGPLFCYIVIPGAAGPLLYRVAGTLAGRWRLEDHIEAASAAAGGAAAATDEFDMDEVEVDERYTDGLESDHDLESEHFEQDRIDRHENCTEHRHVEWFDMDQNADAYDAELLDVDAQTEGVHGTGARGAAIRAAQAVYPSTLAVGFVEVDEPVEADLRAAVAPWGAFAVRAFEAIDWLPVRLSAGGFAVAGNFEDALYCWRAASAAGLGDARTLLLAAGGGALGLRLADAETVAWAEAGPGVEATAGFDAPGGEARPASLQAAASLVWRSLLMWIGLYALITVSAWMGS